MKVVRGVGPGWRVAFATSWIAGQATLVLTAALRPDYSFGFRMFPETSTLEIHLVREVGAERLPAAGGAWRARDRRGQLNRFSWHDRVRDPTIGAVDTRVFASYGVAAQLARLQRALDDVADHIPDDVETSRLGADVWVSKNGGDPYIVTLLSHRRLVRTVP
ncbi:MAG: hypothetical protein M3O46_10205 [Myxococcota bacterium]|nr:hypothetical protein [Myxococcota bacterium]